MSSANTATAAYGLELQARCIAPFFRSGDAPEGTHRFVVGTSSLADENKVYLLDFSEEQRMLDCSAVFTHEGDVASLSVSPSVAEPCLLATTSVLGSGKSRGKIFQVPDHYAGDLKPVCNLPAGTRSVLWDLEGLQNEVRVTVDNKIGLIKLGAVQAGTTSTYTSLWEIQGATRINHAALDPHHSTMCAVATDAGICIVDSRAKEAIPTLVDTKTLHGFGESRFVDYSSSTVHSLISGGDDGSVFFFDLRNTKESSKMLTRTAKVHDHCVNHTLFNTFHEQLVLTCSSDQTVKLWDFDCEDDNANGNGKRVSAYKTQSGTGKPTCIKKLSDFGDSVLSACWSSSGPWVFAAVSYNGKVLADTVPNEKKMQILLKSG